MNRYTSYISLMANSMDMNQVAGVTVKETSNLFLPKLQRYRDHDTFQVILFVPEVYIYVHIYMYKYGVTRATSCSSRFSNCVQHRSTTPLNICKTLIEPADMAVVLLRRHGTESHPYPVRLMISYPTLANVAVLQVLQNTYYCILLLYGKCLH